MAVRAPRVEMAFRFAPTAVVEAEWEGRVATAETVVERAMCVCFGAINQEPDPATLFVRSPSLPRSPSSPQVAADPRAFHQ